MDYSSNISVWNRQDLVSHIGEDDKELIDELMGDVKGEIPNLLAKLRGALGERDTNDLSHNAHTINGMAVSVGAGDLRQAALECEKAAARGDLAAASIAVEAVERAAAKLTRLIDDLGAGRAPATTFAASATPPAPPPVFNRQALMDRVVDDLALAVELAEIFTASTPKIIGQMRERMVAGDADGVARQAHSLKGSAANLGAESLSQTARDMETTARNQDWETCARLMDNIEIGFKEFQTELQASLK